MKRIRLTFFSELKASGWEIAITDRDTFHVYARQAGFSTQQDAHLAAELLLRAMQAVGAELVVRDDWKEARRD